MLQREVADRAARAARARGTTASLTILIGHGGEAVDGCWRCPPARSGRRPKVTSALVRLDFSAGAADHPIRPASSALVHGVFTSAGRRWRTPCAPLRPASIGYQRLFSTQPGSTGGGGRRRWRSTSWCGWRKRSSGRTEVSAMRRELYADASLCYSFRRSHPAGPDGSSGASQQPAPRAARGSPPVSRGNHEGASR